jgi:hypothetical protein
LFLTGYGQRSRTSFFTNKCGNKLEHENEMMHALKKDVLLLCPEPVRNKLKIHSI